MTRFSRQNIGRGLGATAALLALGSIVPMTASAATCTRTISGANSGVVDVAANQHVCLRNAVQDGAVNVAPGGGLSVRGSTITGAVTLESGFTELEFCGSKTVRGAISATGGSRAVVIGTGTLPGGGLLGDLLGSVVPDLFCSANTVDGAVTLDANEGGVQLADTTVAGAVTASANLNGSTISGNRIGGSLTCTTNIPAPTNGGVSNAVAGDRSGQTCAVPTF